MNPETRAYMIGYIDATYPPDSGYPRTDAIGQALLKAAGGGELENWKDEEDSVILAYYGTCDDLDNATTKRALGEPLSAREKRILEAHLELKL